MRFSGLGRSFLYEQMKAGRLPFVKIGAARRIPRRALQRFLAEHLVAGGRRPGRRGGPEMQAIDARRLRAVMVLNGDTVRSLAAKLGLHPSTLSRTLNGRREFRVHEVVSIVRLYRLTPGEVDAIFFPAWRRASA